MYQIIDSLLISFAANCVFATNSHAFWIQSTIAHFIIKTNFIRMQRSKNRLHFFGNANYNNNHKEFPSKCHYWMMRSNVYRRWHTHCSAFVTDISIGFAYNFYSDFTRQLPCIFDALIELNATAQFSMSAIQWVLNLIPKWHEIEQFIHRSFGFDNGIFIGGRQATAAIIAVNILLSENCTSQPI